MYCFPYPQESDVAPLRVPYVASHPYSLAREYRYESFYDTIWGIKSIDSGGPVRGPAVQVAWASLLLLPLPSASAIQSWLFFGLASEALGRDVEHGEFLEKQPVGNSEASIDLRIPVWFLLELQDHWKGLQNKLSGDAFKRKQQELENCFAVAHMVLTIRDVAEGGDTELSLIVLSVHMLLYLISDVLDAPQLFPTSFRFISTQVLIRRMIKNGWCRKRLNFVESIRLLYPALYFLSSLQPQRAGNENHRSCTPANCCVTTKLVEPVHRTDDCQCQDVHVPLAPVMKILAGGGIPLIRIAQSPSGDFSLEVVPYVRTTRFIAISHVWSDRQLGSTKNALPRCQVEYLDSVLAALPPQIRDMSLWDGIPKSRSPRSGAIEPPSRTYVYFWLDTFCVPQDSQYSNLKHKAIGTMNLIYAAARHTLVFDSGLQKFDAGQCHSSLVYAGMPTFYAPADKSLLDVLARLCASNWMGRAWTLQEGILSGQLIFPLKGSLAYLKLLNPCSGISFSFAKLKVVIRARFFRTESTWKLLQQLFNLENAVEALKLGIQNELSELIESLLNVNEYRNYARGSADRGARFVNAHKRLQSRTTTMAQDIPLILMNMSGMNGNIVSPSDGTDQKMKLLFYGLGVLPIELLFSECARLGCCEVDSWIPLEIVPETFACGHVLRLGSEGFTFHQQRGNKPLEFFSVSRSVIWKDEMLLIVSGRPEEYERRYIVKTTPTAKTQSPVSSKNGWCILFEDNSGILRAARFIISRREKRKVFLHFDCPLRLSQIDDDAPELKEQLPTFPCIARPADSQEKFIIEKSSTPQSLGIPRPQNPEQFSERLDFISATFSFCQGYLKQPIMRRLFGDEVEESYFLFITYFIFEFMQREWFNRALHSFVHRAWLQTYSPTWNPHGPWKWFWKLSNYEPPIPFMTINKYICRAIFIYSLVSGNYGVVVMITAYWYPVFPGRELAMMYFNGTLFRALVLYLESRRGFSS